MAGSHDHCSFVPGTASTASRGSGRRKSPAPPSGSPFASVLHDASASEIRPRRDDAVGLEQLPRERRLDVLPSLVALLAAGCIDFNRFQTPRRHGWIDHRRAALRGARRAGQIAHCAAAAGAPGEHVRPSLCTRRVASCGRMQGVARAVAPAVEGDAPMRAPQCSAAQV